MRLLLLVLACDLTGATAEDPEGQGDGTSDSTPTETPDAGATRPMERWSRWACDNLGYPDEYCAAAFASRARARRQGRSGLGSPTDRRSG